MRADTTRLRWMTAVLVTGLVSSLAGRAHAEQVVEPPQDLHAAPSRVVVLRAAGDPALAAALGPGVRDTLFGEARALALTAIPTDAGCAEVSCAHEFLSTGVADLAVLVELAGSDGICERVAVTVITGEGGQFTGAANVAAAGVPDAARIAFLQALSRSRGEAMPTLAVEGAPVGASITLDAMEWGTVPHAEPVSPGEHTVVVSARGHRADRRVISLGAEDLSLEVVLSAATEGGAQSDATPLWISGIGALALGVAGVLVGAVGLAGGESCASSDCSLVSRPDVGASVAWMAAGGALVVGGAVVLGVAASSGGSSATQARLSLTTRF